MEIIPVAGYSLEDKLPIAKRFEQTTFPFANILPKAPSSTATKATRAGGGGR